MFTKRQRITTWVLLAGLSVLAGMSIELLGEIYFPQSRFHTIGSYVFAGCASLGMLAIMLTLFSLAINDWQESKSAANFVSMGQDDRVISVHKIEDAVVHLPVSGTTRQTILAPSSVKVPQVSTSSKEHIHVATELPKVDIMSDELYQKLFGSSQI